jgi:hypothetical protein
MLKIPENSTCKVKTGINLNVKNLLIKISLKKDYPNFLQEGLQDLLLSFLENYRDVKNISLDTLKILSNLSRDPTTCKKIATSGCLKNFQNT